MFLEFCSLFYFLKTTIILMAKSFLYFNKKNKILHLVLSFDFVFCQYQLRIEIYGIISYLKYYYACYREFLFIYIGFFKFIIYYCIIKNIYWPMYKNVVRLYICVTLYNISYIFSIMCKQFVKFLVKNILKIVFEFILTKL